MTHTPTAGDRVVDSDDQDSDEAVVVNLPGKTADEWDVGDGNTVASFPGNEAYADDAPVAIVVFTDELAAHRPGYTDREIPLDELARSDMDVYAFPIPRLSSIDMDTDPRLQRIAERLGSRDVAVEVDGTEGVVRVEKLGETYTIGPDGSVEGDGVLRDRLDDLVSEVVT